MSAMRCSICGINYPLHKKVCPVCEESCWFSETSEVDEWWEWRATLYMNMQQEGANPSSRQPLYFLVPVYELIEGRVWRTPVDAIYRYEQDTKWILLDEGTIIETPNVEWSDDPPNQPVTLLWEVIGVQRAPDQNYYMLMPMLPGDTFPEEWVEEFADGDQLPEG